MNKVVIFGVGSTGKRVYEKIKNHVQVLYFTDNNEKRWGEKEGDIPIKSVSELHKKEFDLIYIASLPGLNAIYKQLINEYHISADSIIRNEVELPIIARNRFLEQFSEHVNSFNIDGNVCEVGVFQGDFAKEINAFFPERKFFLFDTFEGFNESDISVERERGFSTMDIGHLSMTSVEMVLEKLPYPKMCTIKKGYFPDTFDLDKETFCFVNLDIDLYKPTKDGLDIFWPRLEAGGVILVHDYFNSHYPGVKVAVDEFSHSQNVCLMPIGDGFSIALQKQLH